MTKQEIVDGLEGLKDYVNESGKKVIESLKAGVMALREVVVESPFTAAVEEEKEEDIEPITKRKYTKKK